VTKPKTPRFFTPRQRHVFTAENLFFEVPFSAPFSTIFIPVAPLPPIFLVARHPTSWPPFPWICLTLAFSLPTTDSALVVLWFLRWPIDPYGF